MVSFLLPCATLRASNTLCKVVQVTACVREWTIDAVYNAYDVYANGQESQVHLHGCHAAAAARLRECVCHGECGSRSIRRRGQRALQDVTAVVYNAGPSVSYQYVSRPIVLLATVLGMAACVARSERERDARQLHDNCSEEHCATLTRAARSYYS